MSKIDELVATHIFGESRPKPIAKSRERHAVDMFFVGSPLASPGGQWRLMCDYERGDVPTWTPLPYTTVIDVAWLVMEKMRKLGFYPDIRSTSDEWSCVIAGASGIIYHYTENEDGDDSPWVITNTDVKLAICLASLKALGIDCG